MGVYTTQADVKRLLVTNSSLRAGGNHLDFSESFREMRPGSKNTGDIALSRVDFDNSYWGFADFKFTFTSGSAFDLVMLPEGTKTPVVIGSGDTGSQFVAENPLVTPVATMFTVETAYWTGTAQTTAPDKVLFSTNSVMSNEFLEAFILEASFGIDSMILASQRMFTTIRQQLLFQPATLPCPIHDATTKATAFGIYQATHGDQDLSKTQAFQWMIQSRLLVKEYIQSIVINGAQWLSRKGVVPMSTGDDIGTPLFAGDDSNRELIQTSFTRAISRLRDYQINENYVGLQSQSPPFP